MRTRAALWAVLMIVAAAAAFAAGQESAPAGERDEAILTVQVSSAEHELVEGYFTLGDTATIMVKPGSELFNFLARHRGRKVRITLTEASRADLSRLER